jgi:hypothetical protein
LRFAGSFAPRSLAKGETTDHEFRDVLLYDLDRDGKLDLLAAGHVSHKLIVWPGSGKPGFGQAFGAPREIDFPGKGPRALLPISGRIGVAFFDSNEFGWLE